MSTPNLSLLVCEFIRYQSSVFVGVLVCFGGSSRLRSVIGRTDENPRSSNEVKQSDESNHPSLQNTKHRLSSFVTRHSSLVTLVSRLSCVARLDRCPSSPPHPRMQHNAREIVALSEEQITKNNSNTVEHISYNPYIPYLGSTLAADKVSIV